MLVGKVSDVGLDDAGLNLPLGEVTHVIACGLGNRGTLGPLPAPYVDCGVTANAFFRLP